jgi:tetratricopeptide (TPR) repeat protein
MRLLLLPILWVLPALGALSEGDLRQLLEEANGLFRQANEVSVRDPAAGRELYQRAVLRFERLVREGGIRNGKLFYNTGNAYFRAGDIGRAILNYRRAERYSPRDTNLRQNLAYARLSRPDKFDERQKTRVLKTLLFWHYDLAPTTRSVLFAFAWAALWLGASVRRFWSRLPRAVVIAAGCVAVLLLASLVVEAARASRRPAGVILAPEVIARKGDGASYQPAFSEPLHAGTEFVLRESRNGWHYIELPDGRLAWIPAEAAELVVPIGPAG